MSTLRDIISDINNRQELINIQTIFYLLLMDVQVEFML